MTTVELTAYHSSHLEKMRVAAVQQREFSMLSEKGRRALATGGCLSYTILAGGHPMLCGGFLPRWPGRAVAWSYLDEDCHRHILAVHRVARSVIEAAPVRRLEAWVAPENEHGHRWVQMLGFRLEAERMVAFTPQGEDVTLYARVK